MRGTAVAAEDCANLARGIYTCVYQRTAHAADVGIVTEQSAVSVHDGVYRTYGGGFGVDFVQKRHYGLFIRNRRVESVVLAGQDESFDVLLAPEFLHPVIQP